MRSLVHSAIATAIIAALVASPAMAQAVGTKVPEPTDLALFAMGVIGLVIGRRGARRRDRDED
ncbi:PEP-CTERM sorting domain-containing protein [Novosphingobium lentum]|uniref:PEP-CTERM sorting domain-containing protein n=1 Tax=Novosphingobium lentum TaxID=145287 RepID=UPI0008305123|nr:PEP-CTERM sorting domain-containing protein [Novosphingobium lentum]